MNIDMFTREFKDLNRREKRFAVCLMVMAGSYMVVSVVALVAAIAKVMC